MPTKMQNPESDPSPERVPSPQNSPSRYRLCESCLLQYPLEQFRHRRCGGEALMRQCRLCHNQAERLRRQRKRGWLADRQFRQHLTSLKNQRTARGLERVYLDLIREFGGTSGLLKMWTQAIEKDMATGGFRAYRHIASILRLMQHYENAQPNKPDYGTLSDEELLDRLSKATVLDD
jgi:hypothetical protein